MGAHSGATANRGAGSLLLNSRRSFEWPQSQRHFPFHSVDCPLFSHSHGFVAIFRFPFCTSFPVRRELLFMRCCARCQSWAQVSSVSQSQLFSLACAASASSCLFSFSYSYSYNYSCNTMVLSVSVDMHQSIAVVKVHLSFHSPARLPALTPPPATSCAELSSIRTVPTH